MSRSNPNHNIVRKLKHKRHQKSGMNSPLKSANAYDDHNKHYDLNGIRTTVKQNEWNQTWDVSEIKSKSQAWGNVPCGGGWKEGQRELRRRTSNR